ncbi:MAG: 4Fe-4S dicluster domain-containing protein [Deltaproteobacteria bacterium]|nr:MAG: 4Fe-4S dicluster domain-containing protein [Deltaproteobacteria bacterium]
MKGRVRVEVEKCTACKRCMLACATEKSGTTDVLEAMMQKNPARPRVRLVTIEGTAVPTECHHCDAPACLAACPAGAIIKGGPGMPVLLLQERCIGCRSCMVACPYGVIQLDERDLTPYKCDLCVTRLANGQVPACVEACPTGCLSFEQEQQVEGWLRSIKQAVAPDPVEVQGG